jgi:NAD(P)-dependent dehydrogenase (short-subunit alcohol dehydrogenase family)
VTGPAETLEGRTALVTGGGSGIGRGICEELARAGGRILVVDISPGRAADTAAMLTDRGLGARPIALDVTDSAAIGEVRSRLETEKSMPDILVNNAAIFEMGSLEEIDPRSWDRMIEVNLKGPFLMMQAFIPHMVDQDWGRVISISSTAGKTGEAFASHYCAAKRGLIALSQSAAPEVAPVTVNCICPGFVETPMTRTETRFWHSRDPSVSEEQVVQRMRDQIPLGRMGRPEDIARAVRWLSLPTNDYLTGQAINVDGGLDFH